MEYSATVKQYKRMGAEITDDMSEEEVLDAIEAFEERPPEAFEDRPPVDQGPDSTERILAALELQNLLALEERVWEKILSRLNKIQIMLK
jgi:hypothetical protein